MSDSVVIVAGARTPMGGFQGSLPAGLGQGPARQAMRKAGLPDFIGATTINKLCGSGMKATMMIHDAIKAGSISIGVSGGMESMTNAPYVLQGVRSGFRMGAGQA